MKKYFFLLIMALSLTAFVGCDYDDDLIEPNFATLNKTAYTLNVNEGSSSNMEVTVYTGNITNTDRTFTLNVDPSSTLSAAAYTLPATVTVPAGSNRATFTVGVTDTNLVNAFNTNKLVLRLGEQAGLTTAAASTITVNRICPFDIVGDYMITEGTATTTRPVKVIAGTAANQYIAKDLYQEGYDITFTVNPTTAAITIARQPGFVHPTFGAGTVISMAGSQVEACDRRLRILIQRSVAAGNFATRTDILRKVVQ